MLKISMTIIYLHEFFQEMENHIFPYIHFLLTRNHFEFLVIFLFFYNLIDCVSKQYPYIGNLLRFLIWFSNNVDSKNQRRRDPIYS